MNAVRKENFEWDLRENPHSKALSLIVAVRIARRYTHRTPTVADLREQFGMSRATAYRWIAALRDA